jgi:choline dehydrogenase-like flavoprotein
MRDVIIVGAGSGGAAVAKELAQRGLDVLMLEAGPQHKNTERDFTHFELDQNSVLNGVLRFGPADRTRPAWLRELPQQSAISQVAGVGGTSLHYFANYPRAFPGAFMGFNGANPNAYDRAHQFPFTYQELIPYYNWVEKTMPVQTAAMGVKEEIFLSAAERMGLRHNTRKDVVFDSFRPQENAILQPRGFAGRTADPRLVQFPLSRGCTFCGHCLQGCYTPLRAPRNLKAKRSADNSYIPMALTANRWSRNGKPVTIVPNAFATKIHLDNQGQASGVTWRDTFTGALTTETAKVVVLAAGAIESPRLWLNSGLPNPNDWVGRGMTDHHFDLVIGRLPRDSGASRGVSSGARVDFPGRGSMEQVGVGPGGLAQFSYLSDSGVIGLYDNGAPVGTAGADAVGRYAGKAFKNYFSEIDRMFIVVVLTDDDVEPQNRVTLSTNFPPDEHGQIPTVTVNGRGRSARTRANREFLTQKAVQLVRAAGGQQVTRVNFAPLLLHMHSTLRMGQSAADSVLDESAEARWVKRLFVADGSAMANGLGSPNPTLTIQAVATRTAEKIFSRYFGGAPWVGRESPESSISAKVTLAVALQDRMAAPDQSTLDEVARDQVGT